MKSYLMVFLWALSSVAYATKYFVSSTSGNDASDGKSSGTAWKTIAKVNTSTFSPGDTIAFKKGDIWRETLIVPSSGSSGSYISFSSTFGTGANPQFLGSTKAITWTETTTGSHIWKSVTAISSNPYSSNSAEIFYENSDGTKSWGNYKTGTGSLTAEYDWTWVSNNIYIYSASDPTAKYASVEIPQRESAVNMNRKNYIHFDGIDMFYTIHSGYGYDFTHNDMYEQFGLIIENSNIGYIGAWDPSLETGYGIEVVYTDMIVRKNKIHDCGRRSFAMDIYGNGYTARNILVEDNEFFNGFHTTGLDIDVGAGYNGNLDNITIRRNYFHESPSRVTDLSNLVFIQNNAVGTCTITNVYIYDNLFRWQNGYGILMEGIQSAYIYNNVFSEKATACPTWVAFVAAQVNSHVTANNNIFYASSGGSVDALDLSSTYFTHDYNLFFGTSSETETHGQISKNPMFVDAANNNFHLQTGSPAIGSGIAIPLVTTDYEGQLFTIPPNLGIFATQSGTPTLSYISSAIENATPSILSMTYNLSLANIVPASSSFNVMVNSVTRGIGSISIVSGKVQLTLSSPAVYGDIITVSYTKPATNPLQTTSGGQAATIAAQTVANNVLAINPVYVSSVIENATPSILSMTYNLSLANIIPASSSFNVMVNSVTRAVSTVSVTGATVQLTLASPVVFGDVITVSYTKPATNPLQTTSGGQAATIAAQTVTNNVLAINPVYVSSVIENATPSILSMTYNLSLANIVPASSSFNVMVNSVTRGIGSISIVSGKVQLTLSSTAVYGDIITVSYTKPATNPLQTTSGGQAATITAQTVTNNIGAINPVYSSSVIENATPSILSMTYNLSLANIIPSSSSFNVMVNSVTRGIGTVSIVSGKVQLTLSSPTVYGDIITVSYTKPATNPLQTTSGGQAATITAQTVTNNIGAINPVYSSSVIENATPSILSMTYNLSLANIVPASSSFNVMVNSVTRGIGSISIVSGKIQLTLSSPAVYGDIITVSYTKPATNPLQTTSGGQAATITAQTVANNVLAINPVYVSSVIENATPSILSMTYNLSLANIIPASSSFNVMVNSVTRAVSTVSVTGATVQLTLASPVVFGDVITVSYTKPATNPLQTTSGGQAATITAQTVTNNIGAINPVYSSSVIENATPSILSMTYNLSLANIIPSSSSFNVMVNSVTRAVSTVSVTGATVQLTLASPVVFGDVITVSYTKPATNPLQTTSGGQAATIAAQTVTNNVLAINPVYVSSVIENATPSILSMTYNLSLANIVPASSSFNVMVNSVTRGIGSISIVSGKIQLTLSSPAVYGDIITVSYTKPATNPLQTTSGGQAATIAAQTVTNNVLAINPVYVSSVIENATPSILSMTYNLSLANIIPASSSFNVMVNSVTRGIGSISIVSGKVQLTLSSPAVYGDIITVSYTKPATNPLQTTSGGQAATITAQTVTNNIGAINPVYSSSVIENASPSILSITYNMSLANIVPASSSFNVMVNSVTRGIGTVSIVSGKAQLTLSSPAVYGDIITVSYTKPATNPLQTTSGGQAASITAQMVTNNAASKDSPPVILLTYNKSIYSGFIGLIDASLSYDSNHDPLTFEWIVPANIEVSSKTDSKIQFLAPIVRSIQTINLTLKLSDGKSIQSKSISINVIPYRTRNTRVKINSIISSVSKSINNPYNIIDDNLNTSWSTSETGQWLIFELEKPVEVSFIELAFLEGQKLQSRFDLWGSKDNITWEPLLLDAGSSDFADGFQVFEIPETINKTKYSYIKFIDLGNSKGELRYVSEFRLFGASDVNGVDMNVYPNPARDNVNISILNPNLSLDASLPTTVRIIKIVNIRGAVVLERLIEADVNDIQLPINLKPGTYFINLLSGGTILSSKKLIVRP